MDESLGNLLRTENNGAPKEKVESSTYWNKSKHHFSSLSTGGVSSMTLHNLAQPS